MATIPALSRRERQIMDALFARGQATAAELQDAIPDAPSNSAMRSLLKILEEKGHVVHEGVGRVYVYRPTQPIETARRSALQHMLDTFFEGSMESVVAAAIKLQRKRLDPDTAERIAEMIREAAKRGR